jgi:mRNA interferase RelE/StbE
MKINFEKSFLKDIKKLDNKSIANKLKDILENLEQNKTLSNISNVKKLKGHNDYYRIKIGSYRLGFSYKNDTIDIIRFIHRKDIYKVFP